MPTTDEVLLNQLIASHSQLSTSQIGDSERFELFAVELILKDFDLSYDELEAGIVDGGNDGELMDSIRSQMATCWLRMPILSCIDGE